MRGSLLSMVLAAAVAGTIAAPGLADGVDADWPAYNRTLTGSRFSPLDEITTDNVGQLKRTCEMKLGDPGPFQTSPIVIGDTIYLTTANTTLAVDPVKCALKWRNIYKPEQKVVYGANRGAAYLDGVLYRGTGDARLRAIDAESGKTIWTRKVGDPTVGEFFSSAPLAWNGMVFAGPAGSDWGIRGHIMGFDAKTGKEKWRFWTVPMGKEPGAETWHLPASAKRGGGGMWTTYTLDPETGELFVPVANPSPDFAPQYRPGDNLYTNSVVVLDAQTGKLKWYYQFTPGDGFDYDLGAAPVLFTDRKGNRRVAAGSKDGHLYVLDRDTHELVFKTPVTTIELPDRPATDKGGVFACPGALGGVEWNGPAYDPVLDRIFTGAVDWCMTFTTTKEGPAYAPGRTYYGTNAKPSDDQPANGWVTGVEAATGKTAWRYKTPKPVVSGITPTAGGLVFAGDLGGTFYAFDAESGHLLFKDKTKGGLAGGIVTYTIDGKQYVAVTSGNVSRATFGALGSPTLIVYALGVTGAPKVVDISGGAPKAGQRHAAGGGTTDTARAAGAKVYDSYCSGCHGTHGEGGTGPSLINENARKDLTQAIDWIKHPKSPMPSLYPGALTLQQVRDVAKYVETAFRKKQTK